MIKFYIIGQTIRFATPAIAADSLNYLECEFDFSGEGWEEASKWAHFRQGELVYDIAIADDRITADKKLNLTIGEWEVYVTGTIGESRLTTIPVIITVYKSGLIDAPLHEMPLTVAEQVDAKADTALLLAQAVKDMADSGVFKGEDGKDGKDGKDGSGIEIGDYFNTLSELESKAPKDDKLYGVGSDPVIFYGWSDAQQSWIYVGSVQGIPGKDGAQGEPGTPGRNGVIFYPSVSDSGFLSWTNDGGLTNPQTVNIMGPKGETGETGANGKGPYEYAQDGGYTGTEATFITAMTQFPYHHTRHEPGGVDPITVSTGMIAPGAVTRAKLAQDALYSPVKLITDGYSIQSEDIGVFLYKAYGSDINISLTNAFSSQLVSHGPEIPIVNWGGGSVTIAGSGGIVFCVNGEKSTFADKAIKITEPNATVALKKMGANTSGNVWWVIGDVEVVT